MLNPNLTTANPLFKVNDCVVHKKGSMYVIVAHAIMEATLEHYYVYKSISGKLWIRPFSEMEDGRFKLLES